MSTATSQRFAKKSDWAAAQADALMRQSLEMEGQSSGGSTRRAARKFDAIRRLRAESERFRGIAQALRRKGK